jgi:dihydrofolate reductase
MQKVLQVIQSDNPEKTIWVIGGADIYRQALPFCDRLYLTKFKQHYECDAYIDRALLLPFQKFVTGEGLSNEDLSFTVWSKI